MKDAMKQITADDCEHDDIELENTLSFNAFQESYTDIFICKNCEKKQEVHWIKEGETEWK